MPEPKKHQSSVKEPEINQNHSKEQDVAITESIVMEDSNPRSDLVEPEIKENVQTPLNDMMKNEPVLVPIIVERYEGEFNENGFYHGKGCTYLKGGIVYKGWFKNGKMHGQGTCSWPNGTVFVGDFVENVITGRGVYSWPDGNTYDGEVCNGLRHGFGTFKCKELKSYAGEWKNGKRHGKGIIYYDHNGESYYDGNWCENTKAGFGIRRFKNGNMYEGNWENNKRNGKGTMYWYNLGQEYSGDWVDGIQTGYGENIWFLKRVSNSQYPLRNHYIGEFLNGERHGNGIFYYASGAIYNGQWKNNMKHGDGKFIFKNGCVFSGKFSDDHMLEFPELILSGMTTPDISQSGLPVKSPMSLRSTSVVGMSGAAVDAFLDINIDDVLSDYKYDLEQRQDEINKIVCIILRFTSQMKHMYKFYSCLGVNHSIDNTYVMSKLQYCRFLKDYKIHTYDLSLVDIERSLDDQAKCVDDCFKKIFTRDFLESLVKISCLIFKGKYTADTNEVSKCFSDLVAIFTSNRKADVNGIVYKSIEQTQEIMIYINECLKMYFHYAQRKHDVCLSMRDVLFVYKELRLINQHLTAKSLVKILTKEVLDATCYNLDVEITPLEFLEVLVESASLFVTAELIAKHNLTELSDVLPVFELPTIPSAETTIDETDNGENKNEKTEALATDNSHHSETIDVVPSRSSGQTSEKVSHKGSKKSKSDSKKVDKESALNLRSKSKERKDEKLKVEKKASKLDELKSKSSSVAAKHGDSTLKITSSRATQETQSGVKTNSLSIATSLQSEKDEEKTPQDLPVDSSTSNATSNREQKQLSEEPSIQQEDDDFDTWSLKLNLFFNEYLFPAFRKSVKINDVFVKSNI
ncbi:radial spoke head 10 homolog B2-like isoform X2 [Hydractinia symbiolongicarpus]|uniref:radial spoke head 10 homolog B2-like isoform X2 n=1 Tax=Hydractinia symbiolongicarpus TaxID=13093 RepID=UPI002550E0AB|nr:radial spoke head 10 homolog B2-like isoform X2 [Hydractinia symbiolongicarpus]